MMNERRGEDIAVEQRAEFSAREAQRKSTARRVADQAEFCIWIGNADVVDEVDQIVFQLADVVDVAAPSGCAVSAHVECIGRYRLCGERRSDSLHRPAVCTRTMDQNGDPSAAVDEFAIGKL